MLQSLLLKKCQDTYAGLGKSSHSNGETQKWTIKLKLLITSSEFKIQHSTPHNLNQTIKYTVYAWININEYKWMNE